MSLSYVWPIALVVISNVVYQVCAKSVPREMDAKELEAVYHMVMEKGDVDV